MSDVGTMNMFITRALQKIQRLSSKKHVALREACAASLDKLAGMESAEEVPETSGPPGDISANADEFFEPFRLACESRNAKMMETSLDCLQKLIAYGYLTGTLVEDTEAGPRPLMDSIVETICGCAEFPDDHVQLQIIKALLTTVTSSTCNVHDNSLLAAVRTCYTIHLVSKNLVNQTTAKATLTQMVNIIFQRMEAQTTDMPGGPDNQIVVPPRLTPGGGIGLPLPLQETDPPVLEAQPPSNPAEATTEEYLHSFVNRIVQMVGQGETEADLVGEPGPRGWCAECGKAATLHIPETSESVCSTECQASNIERHIHTHGTNTPSVSRASNDSVPPAPPSGVQASPASKHSRGRSLSEFENSGDTTIIEGGPGFADVLQKDAFLVFRALCKLSMKKMPEGASPDSIDMRSKTLALELLLSLLENSGPIFSSSDEFISAIKQYLCMSLLGNCVSPVPSIFRLSLSIFVMLLVHFKDYLKTQIGIFFTNIFFRILESSNSSYMQKMMVLQVFSKICQDAQTLVDIFVNYDCDVELSHIFERMVNDLSRIAQGTVTDHHVTAQQEQTMKILALQSLVYIIRSLVDWSRDLAEEDESTDDDNEDDADGTEYARPPPDAGAESELPKQPGTPEAESGEASKDPTHKRKNSRKVTLTKGGGEDDLRPELFEKQLQFKRELDKGVAKFNMKPKKGIQYIVEQGLVEHSAEAIAQFLHTAEGLDKEKIGEYLGEGEPENKSVLYAYTDSMDFKNLHFDDALRHFLSGFRLPGEAQKIDRMMEKFAERYCTHNAGVFATADTAYVLAYSVIMLNTDLHSSQVKVKMTLEDFTKNNRGIDDGNDIDPAFLAELYDRILNNEIKCNLPTATVEGKVTNKKRRDLFQGEAEEMVKSSQALFRERGNKESRYYSATHAEHTKPMFEVCWCPMMAAFSVLLEDSEDPRLIELCLEGFRHAIRISSIFSLETERNAFVSSLAKFTFLPNSKREMKPKNIESIKTMIEIAHTEGNHLQTSWLQVLSCISQLERLQLIGQGSRSAEQVFEPNAPQSASPAASTKSTVASPGSAASPATNVPGGRSRKERAQAMERELRAQTTEEINSITIADHIDQTAIDKIFHNSANLSSTAIVEFVTHLCAVSVHEISAPEPRIFSLQKIVEIAYYNMGRIRIIWSRIWSILSQHFKTVGCHKNLSVAMYAIDSLRQLAMKFLEKDELSNYQFQNAFLQPFDHIIHSNQSLEIRELIIRCLSHMILARVYNIKSGWKSMFKVFTIAATDGHESLVNLGFEMVEKIVREYFHLISGVFIDCVKCLLAYANNELSNTISVRAIEHVHLCAQQLATGKVILPGYSSPVDKYTDDPVHVKYWFSVLTGLSGCVSDLRLQVRSRACDSLFSIVQTQGHTFTQEFWALVYKRVLFPMFDGVLVFAKDNEWMRTTCPSALSSLVELFAHFYPDQSAFILEDLVTLLSRCVTQDNEGLARFGVQGFTQLLKLCGNKFDEPTWTFIAESLKTLFSETSPRALFEFGGVAPGGGLNPSSGSAAEGGTQGVDAREPAASTASVEDIGGEVGAIGPDGKLAPTPMNFRAVRCKCIVQLLLIQAINDVVFLTYDHLSNEHMSTFLDAIEESFTFAHKFNSDMPLRVSLWKAGFMNQLPNLLKQETNGLLCYLRMLFRLYGDDESTHPGRRTIAESRLVRQCEVVIKSYIGKDAQTNSVAEEREVLALTPIVVLILKGFLNMELKQFTAHLPLFYEPFCNLMQVESREVRQWLRDVFRTRIGPSIPGVVLQSGSEPKS